MKRFRLALGAILFSGLLTASVAVAAEPAKAPAPAKAADASKPLPDPVARVNGIPISRAEFSNAYKALQGAQGHIPADKTVEAQKYVLNQLIIGELMYQVSKNTPVADLDKKMNDAVAKLKARFKSTEEYEKGLKEQGMTEKQLRELIRRNLVIENHIEKAVVAKVTVSPEEVKAFYDKNPESFTMPEQVRASHILITVDAKATEADKQKARAKAEDLLKQIKGGADFATLAKEQSGCPSSKEGGDLGYFSKGQMVKPFEETVWGMKIGEISNVVETQFGYHIIKLTGRKQSEKIAFNTIKDRVEQNLKQQKIGAGINAMLETAKKSAKIETYLK